MVKSETTRNSKNALRALRTILIKIKCNNKLDTSSFEKITLYINKIITE